MEEYESRIDYLEKRVALEEKKNRVNEQMSRTSDLEYINSMNNNKAPENTDDLEDQIEELEAEVDGTTCCNTTLSHDEEAGVG